MDNESDNNRMNRFKDMNKRHGTQCGYNYDCMLWILC